MKVYKISIIIPIYNTGEYLEETLRDVVNQSIGVKNMQIILVNDGSTDYSSDICKEFQEKYGDNVVYREFSENHGVSYARNVGISIAEGKYITFWDSDDLWDLNALEEAVKFLEENEKEIDVVSAGIRFFDNGDSFHPLNFELEKHKVIDIHKDYQKIRSAGAASVIKTVVAKYYQFDESQSCWEDTKFLNQIILRKQKYGMLSGVTYYYRRRKDESSASQTYTQNKKYFLHDLSALFDGIYSESIKQCNEFIPMMQYLMAYALGYRFTENITVLDEYELKQYHGILKKCLSLIDDKYLNEIINVNAMVKWEMLSFKYGINSKEGMSLWCQRERDINYLALRVGRMNANYNILKKWFELKLQKKQIAGYFQNNHYKQIAIYGMSDLGNYLLQELVNTGIEVIYAIDRRAGKIQAGIPILSIEDELSEVDAIIITATYFFNQIDEDLRKKVHCPVISIEDVLYTIE